MSKNKTAKEKRPWHILIWLILYLVNLLAALAFQYFFIHTYSAPLTAESLGSISYFNGCEILDISGEGVPDNSLIGKSSPDWILYKNQAGETHAVRIEWNLYMPRFRIEKNSNTLIPNEESYTFSMRDFLEKNEVTVENQEAIVQLKWSGLFRQQCCFSKRMRKVFRKNEKSMLQNCNKKAKRKGRLQRVKKPM